MAQLDIHLTGKQGDELAHILGTNPELTPEGALAALAAHFRRVAAQAEEAAAVLASDPHAKIQADGPCITVECRDEVAKQLGAKVAHTPTS